MSKLANQWVDVFAAGDHGAKGQFNEQDLQQIVSNYDPAHHEAPAVIGHPTTDAPAYGWVKGLRAAGKILQAKFAHVNPAFEELVESGAFKKRSVSLYKGANGWSLRHVGFLGAQPPEIKGLADIKFGQEDQNAVAIDFAEESGMADNNDAVIDGVWARLKTTLGIKDGNSTDKTFSEAQVTQIAREAAFAAVTAAVAPLETKLAAHEAKFAESNTAAATTASKTRAADAVNKLKTDGKWLPAFEKMGLAVIFTELAKNEETVTFGEGDAKATKTPLDLLVSFMEGLPKVVPGTRIYNGQTPAGAVDTSKFNPAGRAAVDDNSVKLHTFAETRAKEKHITYGEALSQVIAEKPELAAPSSASAGAV